MYSTLNLSSSSNIQIETFRFSYKKTVDILKFYSVTSNVSEIKVCIEQYHNNFPAILIESLWHPFKPIFAVIHSMHSCIYALINSYSIIIDS